MDIAITTILTTFFTKVLPNLTEDLRRIVAGCMSEALGYGGIQVVKSCSGLAKNTILKGIKEINNVEHEKSNYEFKDLYSEINSIDNNGSYYERCKKIIDKHVKHLLFLYDNDPNNEKEIFKVNSKIACIYNNSKVADGRIFILKNNNKKNIRKYNRKCNSLTKYNNIIYEVNRIIANDVYGDPEKVVKYTTWSLREIQIALKEIKIDVSINVIAKILLLLGFSLQKNDKLYQIGDEHPLRNEQFLAIQQDQYYCRDFNIPAISIDAKASVMLGLYANCGSEYRPIGSPRPVNDHDFPNENKLKLFVIYSIVDNMGLVCLNKSHDTPHFAYNSLKNWWNNFGNDMYPNSKELHIYLDCGGSNGIRLWLWKFYLQKFADETGLSLNVMYYPQGTSKWNKIEHSYFCHISRNWRGKPLSDIDIVGKFINDTTTRQGLVSHSIIDNKIYEKGEKITKEQKNGINIKYDDEEIKWNFIIYPK